MSDLHGTAATLARQFNINISEDAFMADFTAFDVRVTEICNGFVSLKHRLAALQVRGELNLQKLRILNDLSGLIGSSGANSAVSGRESEKNKKNS